MNPYRESREAGVAARALAAIAAGLLITACTTYPPAPRDAATSDFQYKIGPLDTINIIVWRNPELSMIVPVRPDGNVTTPLADDIPALGKRQPRSPRTSSKRYPSTFATRL